ncbi:hypothetical protein VE04_01652 [Pseudogymnoascus sp. 24MN13]|nr:hypothetical protein VE04_01652 [Pseudogymnoascus sp. 24MN13]
MLSTTICPPTSTTTCIASVVPAVPEILLLKEANQEVPAFLENIAREGAGFGSSRGGRTGGRARGGAANRDFRKLGGSAVPFSGGFAGGPPAAYGGGGSGGASYNAAPQAYGGAGGYGGGSYGNPSGPGGQSSWW